MIFLGVFQNIMMKNPIFNRQHFKEYLAYGLIAAVLYTLSVIYFLSTNDYENFYVLFIGSAAFMFVVFSYAYKLTYRPYDKKRAVSMLIAGSITTLIGVIASVILVIIAFLFFHPRLFSTVPVDHIMENSPDSIQPNKASGLLLMIMAITVMVNAGVGAVISVITAYAGKQDQTEDKPASLETNLR